MLELKSFEIFQTGRAVHIKDPHAGFFPGANGNVGLRCLRPPSADDDAIISCVE
ncbi:MAG: hypothetical protein QGG09_11825 [Pirellulaceae bacterium]|nr:hypothetical protein [Pirellulaceae bacterium]HJN12612.1 hypothetical protein [Pirellulaceae bacterium]